MGSKSSQKFIARNRAPRVQIEYDVEVYGSEKKVHLPFVQGVMADLNTRLKFLYPLQTVDFSLFVQKGIGFASAFQSYGQEVDEL